MSARLRRAFIWLVALAPLAGFTSLSALHHMPPTAEGALVRLTGTWKVHEGGEDGLGAFEVDDEGWRELSLPGSYSGAGFRSPHAWLRKRFELPENLAGKNLFFMLGDTRSGIAEVFVNGAKVGETEPGALGDKSDLSGVDGWTVPSQLLRPGPNVLALRFTWHFLGEDGVSDPRLFLGDVAHLKPYYLANSEARHLMQFGVVFLMGFLFILFVALAIVEWRTASRPMYLSTLMLLGSTLTYIMVNAGLTPLRTDHYWFVPLIYLLAAGMGMAIVEFVARFYFGGRSRFLWVSRATGLTASAAVVATTLFGPSTAVRAVYDVYSAFLIVPLLYILWVSIRSAWKSPRELDPILIVSFAAITGTGTHDLLNDLYVIQGPRLFQFGVAAGSIGPALVLIGDFIKLFLVNRELSSSLTKTNGELAKALVKAQESARLKGEFVANVSHELRTPLNSVINVPEGLLDFFPPQSIIHCGACSADFEKEEGDRVDQTTPCPRCQRAGALQEEVRYTFQGEPAYVAKSLERIHQSGTHLLRLIDDVLDFSKLESGKMTLHFERVRVVSVIDEVCQALEPSAAKRKIRLDTVAPDGDFECTVDRLKLVQVLMNLCGNAIKFSHEGGVVTARVTREGELAHFVVEDRGIGIAQADHATIFESFRQVDGSHTRKYGGTGLGLSITRKLVEAHHGRIWVESTLGQGSTFHFRLPLSGPSAQAQPAPIAAAPRDREPLILVVDDEPAGVENVRIALRGRPFRVEGLNDPTLLPSTLASLEPDLLVLDVMMPAVSGLELLRSLRARGNPLPVIVSSAHHANAEMLRGLGAAWVAKPLKRELLLAEIERLLAPAEPLEEPAATAPDSAARAG